MIYSKRLQSYIPITVQKVIYRSASYPNITKYTVKDGKIPVGTVSISDLPNGAYVEFIENMNPELYRNFTDTAYQIQVEHCLQRGLKNFKILSNASLNSHAIHYLQGKRFIPKKINKIVENVIKNTPSGGQFYTRFLGSVKMYMPSKLIAKYLEKIKQSPILEKNL